MPSKKRKYNARFPAGRIKKIMQTDEEVGKVAQAVPIIIPRTLELFVESLLTKAKQVTMARNAKTLSPSHVKQCILAESRFDFLRDLVKNIPDVSAAEEKEMVSAESSPNSSRFSDMTVPPRRIVREDSSSSSGSDFKVQQIQSQRETIRALSSETELPNRTPKTEPPTATVVSSEAAIDLTKKTDEKPVRTANFYQETLLIDEVQHKSVITANPTYIPQPSTSYNLTPLQPVPRIEVAVPKQQPMFYVDLQHNNNHPEPAPRTPVTPILNIDFSKNIAKPEIKVLDTAVAKIVGVSKPEVHKNSMKHLPRQNSKPKEIKKVEIKPVTQTPINIDHLNSGNLQIDEDYDT
ncbi:uncharacterized protein LOC113523214 [Galleria mellonella]|uniref:Uncharacterized protein LOC113523214 n=1 Tax=Galleria mellonella TaxID=7137 RepID=A0ABM3M923_GALME|nr:uncharacterized protein LOC113523214 [Galleria mellonella]